MRKILFVGSVSLFIASTLGSCGLGNTETERQEVLDRLRALGVAVEPLVSQIPAEGETPSAVTLTLHAVVPGDTPVTVEAFKNPGRTGANVVLTEKELSIDTANIQEQKIGELRILAIKATTTVPLEKVWRGARGGTVQYGFKLTSGSRTEYVSGEFLAFRKDEPELAWKNPTLQIKFPDDGGTVAKDKDNEIGMEVTKSQDELLLPGWFVTSGSILGRRLETTTWKPSTTGEQAVVATARGADSLGFAIKVIKVTAQ